VILCEEQSQPDGNFPNAPSPNPEEPKALEAAIRTARQIQADLVLATDPDADRVGAAVRDGDDFPLLTGNQMVAMLVDYVLGSRKRAGKLPADARVCTTIVTSELVLDVAGHYGVPVDLVLTGFKWIGEKILQYELSGKGQYMVGGEESYGYLVGTHARDKDAVVSACFIAEMLADSKSRGESLVDRLNGLHKRHGVYEDSQISMKFEGAEGKQTMNGIMSAFRRRPPEAVAGDPVVKITDIQTDEVRTPDGKVVGRPNLPKSNVLIFHLASGSRVMARPSGTEPKIKFYFSVRDTTNLPIATDAALAARREKLSRFHEEARREMRERVQKAAQA
jgi:phosphoglucomutase